MTVDFASLKKKAKTNLDSMKSQISQEKIKKYDEEDTRFWTCKRDKAGNGYAVIRFLPAPKGEDFAWVKIFHHSFKSNLERWYIENSLTTIGKDDPVYELNGKLYSTKNEADEAQAKEQRRKVSYYSNIYVVSDPENPENEGKVFLFKYGKRIFDKIAEALQPMENSGEDPVNVFDFWEGANFKLKIKIVDKQTNYDSSLFSSPSALSDDDEVLEKIWNQEHSLSEFLNESNFKPYDVLKKRLDYVLGKSDSAYNKPTPKKEESKSDDEDDSQFVKEEPKKEEKSTSESLKSTETSDIGEDDIDDYFASLK